MPDDQPKNLEADTNSAKALDTFIKNKSCVLLLGPLFAIDPGGKKIHETLRAELGKIQPAVDIDEEFDNLYISRTENGLGNALMFTSMVNFYQNSTRNNIYDSILKIGFRAIISFSADAYLTQADIEKTYDAYYYSSKPKEADLEVKPANFVSTKPVLYNLFGSIDDFNSLVTDYDSLYDFLIGLLKADQELPLELKDTLKKATAFLLVGFDLSKWYVPLIIRKLSQFILKDARKKSAVNAFATLNDTPSGVTPAVFASLNKYPFSFIPFKNMESQQLLNYLALLPVPGVNVNGQAQVAAQSAAEVKTFFQTWSANLDNLPREEGLPVFFYELGQLNYRGKFAEQFSFQKLNFLDAQSLYNAGRMLLNEFVVKYHNIKAEVQISIKELLNA